MSTIKIERWWETPRGTFGRLFAPGEVLLWTVEREWRDNRPWVSCIPAGTYAIREGIHRGGQGPDDDYPCIELVEVQDRTDIEIHVANRASELAGCIGVGYELGCVDGEWAVLESRRALETLLLAMRRRKLDRLDVHPPPILTPRPFARSEVA